MNESLFLGSLLPSHPDLLKIEQSIREKYNIPELSPGDDSIVDIYLGERAISLEEFHEDIVNYIRENMSFFPPDLLKAYQTAKDFSTLKRPKKSKLIPDELTKERQAIYNFSKLLFDTIIQIVDPMINSISDILYLHLLYAESQEIPYDWISKVTTVKSMGETMVMAMAGQLANPEDVIQEFRKQYKKTFGDYHPRITKKTVGTAYYMRLRKSGKPWDFIVEEYFRINRIKLPHDRNSRQYIEKWHTAEQTLKKSVYRVNKILDVLIKDIN